MKIKDLKLGEIASVVGYEKEGRMLRDRLISMGMTRGTQFKLVKMAPLGDPVEIEVRGFSLTLRKAEADIVIVEETTAN